MLIDLLKLFPEGILVHQEYMEGESPDSPDQSGLNPWNWIFLLPNLRVPKLN